MTKNFKDFSEYEIKKTETVYLQRNKQKMEIDWLHLIPMKLLVNTIDEEGDSEEENEIEASSTFEKTHRKLHDAIAKLEVSNFSSIFQL